MSGVLLDVVGPDLASHRGVAHHSLSTHHGSHQFPVHRAIESHLAEIQFDFDVASIQSVRYCTAVSHGPQRRWIEVHLDPDLDIGHQQFIEMKDFDVGDLAKDPCLAIILAEFLLECLHHVLVFFGQGFEIIVGCVQLIVRQSIG